MHMPSAKQRRGEIELRDKLAQIEAQQRTLRELARR